MAKLSTGLQELYIAMLSDEWIRGTRRVEQTDNHIIVSNKYGVIYDCPALVIHTFKLPEMTYTYEVKEQ